MSIRGTYRGHWYAGSPTHPILLTSLTCTQIPFSTSEWLALALNKVPQYFVDLVRIHCVPAVPAILVAELYEFCLDAHSTKLSQNARGNEHARVSVLAGEIDRFNNQGAAPSKFRIHPREAPANMP